ncbi:MULTISPECIES: hypothetical protein [Bacillus cereus group]|uniref:Uncharacterized protein n=1 Tax=Bacillus thuringiensis TaxID=1428 RepID=A0A9X6VCS7_BACTU|nr:MULTISPECIES: hypothetical protein [Bacillus cereus group]MEC3270591.1 hypothetical protein [Bacillus thuringiensis]PFB08174.1 hypothetical protein CN398_10700 [Bacillus thuringiensis]
MFKYKIAKTLPTKVLLSIPYTGLHALNNFLNGEMGYVAMCGVISVVQLFCFKKLKKFANKMKQNYMKREEKADYVTR